jgi:hypothetical protein
MNFYFHERMDVDDSFKLGSSNLMIIHIVEV